MAHEEHEPEADAARLIDRPREIREGEALDTAALQVWLREAGVLEADEQLRVLQFPSGYSNLTYLLEVEGSGSPRGLVLRRPPFGNTIKSGHDMGREYRVLRDLHRAFPLAPRPLAHCEANEVIGAPFYVMERIEGLILRRSLPRGLDWGPKQARGLAHALVDRLAELHQVDYGAAGLGDLGQPEGYIRRQVDGWTRRYDRARTDEVPAMDALARWLDAQAPADDGLPPALIHNDYKYDNVVLDPGDPTRIIGVLDWEMATLGSPLMDLGTTLAYWIEAGDDDEMKMFAFGPTHQPGSPTRRELVDRYAEARGLGPIDPTFFYVFGLYKIAVIIQQIFARYQKGLTKDPRFAPLGHFVKRIAALGEQAAGRGHL